MSSLLNLESEEARIFTLVDRAVFAAELLAELAMLRDREASELVGLGLLLAGFQPWLFPPFAAATPLVGDLRPACRLAPEPMGC